MSKQIVNDSYTAFKVVSAMHDVEMAKRTALPLLKQLTYMNTGGLIVPLLENVRGEAHYRLSQSEYSHFQSEYYKQLIKYINGMIDIVRNV